VTAYGLFTTQVDMRYAPLLRSHHSLRLLRHQGISLSDPRVRVVTEDGNAEANHLASLRPHISKRAEAIKVSEQYQQMQWTTLSLSPQERTHRTESWRGSCRTPRTIEHDPLAAARRILQALSSWLARLCSFFDSRHPKDREITNRSPVPTRSVSLMNQHPSKRWRPGQRYRAGSARLRPYSVRNPAELL
jgi:hypothetical protein